MISSDDIVVMQADWDDQIKDAWAYSGFDYRNPEFLDTIWEMSLTALDIGREVQVVIDGKMNIYISAGDPGFVWFKEPPKGMCLPIECWIHTHPFGSAYFSGRDWLTINTWRMMLPEAIVLGGAEKMTWFRDGEYTEFIRRDYYEVVDGQTKLDDWREEE